MKKLLTATLILNALIQAAATAEAAPVTRRRLAQQAAPAAPVAAGAVADPLADDGAIVAPTAPLGAPVQRAGVIPSSASAASPISATSTSVSTSAPAAPAKRVKVQFGYDGATSGLRNLKSAESPDDFNPTGGGALEHRFFVAVPYKLAEKVSITPQVSILVTGRAGEKAPPQQIMDVPFVTLKVKDVIKTKSYDLAAAFRTYFGVTNAMHDRGRMASFRYTAAQTFNIPDTKVSLGLEAYLQGHMYRETYADTQRIRRYLNPTITYQATDDTSVGLSFEQRATNLMGDATMFTYAEESQNFQAVVNSNLTPNLNLNTGLDFKPHGRINMDTTQLFATLIWTVN